MKQSSSTRHCLMREQNSKLNLNRILVSLFFIFIFGSLSAQTIINYANRDVLYKFEDPNLDFNRFTLFKFYNEIKNGEYFSSYDTLDYKIEVFARKSESEFYCKMIINHKIIYSEKTINNNTTLTYYYLLKDQIKRVAHINDAALNGIQIEYDSLGSLKGIWNYFNGLEDGSQYFLEKNTLIKQITFRKGKIDGTLLTFYKNGRMKEFSFADDGKVKLLNYFDENGTLIFTGDGILHRKDSSSNILSICRYKNGYLNGISKFYDRPGIPELVLCYKKGVLDGVAKEFDENGKLKRSYIYKNGEIVGEVKTYSDF